MSTYVLLYFYTSLLLCFCASVLLCFYASVLIYLYKIYLEVHSPKGNEKFGTQGVWMHLEPRLLNLG